MKTKTKRKRSGPSWPRGAERVCLGHVSDSVDGNGRMSSTNLVNGLKAAGIPARREPGSYYGHSLVYVPEGYGTKARAWTKKYHYP